MQVERVSTFTIKLDHNDFSNLMVVLGYLSIPEMKKLTKDDDEARARKLFDTTDKLWNMMNNNK